MSATRSFYIRPFERQRIETLLAAQGRQRLWLAAQLGITKEAFSRKLAGHVHHPLSANQAHIIANSLGVPVSWIFDHDFNVPTESDEGSAEKATTRGHRGTKP